MLGLILALSLTPTSAPLVDCVEHNTLYRCERGEYVVALSQVVLWRWTAEGLRVAEWHTATDFRVESGRAYWLHGGRLYSVRYKSKRETHTLTDPERADRELLPVEQRRPYF